MQISATIGNEAYFFLLSILEGMGLVLVYDVFRIFRRLIKHGNIWIGIEDLLYWLFCFFAVFLLLYKENDGMVRLFAFVGILAGCGIYYFLFSKAVIKICVAVLSKILMILGKILAPFLKTGKKILVFLKKQLKKLYRTIKMSLCKL